MLSDRELHAVLASWWMEQVLSYEINGYKRPWRSSWNLAIAVTLQSSILSTILLEISTPSTFPLGFRRNIKSILERTEGDTPPPNLPPWRHCCLMENLYLHHSSRIFCCCTGSTLGTMIDCRALNWLPQLQGLSVSKITRAKTLARAKITDMLILIDLDVVLLSCLKFSMMHFKVNFHYCEILSLRIYMSCGWFQIKKQLVGIIWGNSWN